VAQTTEELEAQKIIDDIIRRLEEYHVNGNWDEFFDNDVLDVLLLTTPDKEDVLGFSILLSYGGPSIEFLCDRGDGKIIYSYGDIEVKKDVDPDICDDIINYLDS
jgi:predicted flavoprotein YhiN